MIDSPKDKFGRVCFNKDMNINAIQAIKKETPTQMQESNSKAATKQAEEQQFEEQQHQTWLQQRETINLIAFLEKTIDDCCLNAMTELGDPKFNLAEARVLTKIKNYIIKGTYAIRD